MSKINCRRPIRRTKPGVAPGFEVPVPLLFRPPQAFNPGNKHNDILLPRFLPLVNRIKRFILNVWKVLGKTLIPQKAFDSETSISTDWETENAVIPTSLFLLSTMPRSVGREFGHGSNAEKGSKTTFARVVLGSSCWLGTNSTPSVGGNDRERSQS